MALELLAISEQEYFADLQAFESDIMNQKSSLRDILNSGNREIFHRWAYKLESGIKAQFIKDMEIKQIAERIRHKLVEAGLEESIPYMYEVLPAKYKQHRANQTEKSDNPTSDSSTLTSCPKCSKQFTPSARERLAFKATCPRCNHPGILIRNFKHENKNWLNLTKLWKQALTLLEKKLNSQPFEAEILRRQPGETDQEYNQRASEYEQDMVLLYAALQLFHEILDGRERVPYATQHLLMGACLELNTNEAGALYYKHAKGLLDLTRKQATKIVTHLIGSALKDNGYFDFTKIKDLKGKLHIAFEPHNAKIARLRGWFGHECPECGNWRVRRRYNSDRFNLFCENCKSWWDYESDPPFVDKGHQELYTVMKGGKPVIEARPAAFPTAR